MVGVCVDGACVVTTGGRVGGTGTGVGTMSTPGGGHVEGSPSNRILTSFMSTPFDWLAEHASKVILLTPCKSTSAVNSGLLLS
jgi:hypothetical protein